MLHPTGRGEVIFDKDQVDSFASEPLKVIGFDKYIEWNSFENTSLDTDSLSDELPFDVSEHSGAKSHIAREMIDRLDKDMSAYASICRNTMLPSIRGLAKEKIHATFDNQASKKEALTLVRELEKALRELKSRDEEFMEKSIDTVLGKLNGAVKGTPDPKMKRRQLALLLGQASDLYACGTLDVIIQCFLSSEGNNSLRVINPLLSDEDTNDIFDGTASILCLGCRIAQTSRCIMKVTGLLKAMERLCSAASPTNLHFQDVTLKSDDFSQNLVAARHFIKIAEGGQYAFDPRYLVFEFAHNILLRKSQCELVDKFRQSIEENGSLCHPMIMGAGKTTVVAPLLALLYP